MRAPVERGGEARRVGDVADGELGTPARRLRAALRPAHEHPHLAAVRAQGVHHPRPDEPRAAGDEDLHVWKFCQ